MRYLLASWLFGCLLLSYSFLTDLRTAQAAVEEWWPGHSWVQLNPGWRQTIKPLGQEIEGSAWWEHYNNAQGSWNDPIGDDPFLPVGPESGAAIHVVAAGSIDEAILDSIKADSEGYFAYDTCNGAAAGQYWWGTPVPYTGNGDPLGGHYTNYKVCIWTSRVPDDVNGQGWHYRWLTIKHELGHIFSLGDDVDGSDNCLMLDGYGMLEICTSELNYVREHYNRW